MIGVVAGGLACFAVPGQALVKWDLGASWPGCASNGTSGVGNTRTCTSDTPGVNGVEATAWANTGPTQSTSDQGDLAPATVNVYIDSGLGITHGDNETTSSPQHAMDNNNRFELLLFDFDGEEVALDYVHLGWVYNDADFFVMAFDPGNTNRATPNLTGLEFTSSSEELTGAGWELLGAYDANSVGTVNLNNTGEMSSSFWLVGAYNPVFASACGGCDWGSSSTYDYVKLEKLWGHTVTPPNGNTPGVPAPASLLLLLGGLAPLAWRRRHLGREALADC